MIAQLVTKDIFFFSFRKSAYLKGSSSLNPLCCGDRLDQVEVPLPQGGGGAQEGGEQEGEQGGQGEQGGGQHGSWGVTGQTESWVWTQCGQCGQWHTHPCLHTGFLLKTSQVFWQFYPPTFHSPFKR